MPKAGEKKQEKKSGKKETLILLDMHAIIHRAYHALPEFTSPKGEPVGALYGLSTMLMKIIRELKPDHVVAAYDLPGPTHRHEVYKEYKAKRPQLEDDLRVQINRSREVLNAFSIPIYEAPGFEADDVIGTIATKAKKHFDVIVASGDMDTLQLVDKKNVRVFTLRKGIQDTILYDEDAVIARYGFAPQYIPDFKGFAGDKSDNIIGIPGIGEKTATALIKEFGAVEDVYKVLKKTPEKLKRAGVKDRAFELIKEHEDEAEFSKVLATIRLDAPVDFVEPEKTIQESVDVSKISTLMSDLGFRSLTARARDLFNGGTAAPDSGEPAPATRGLFAATVSDSEKEIFKEASVMLWLTQSELTNPSLEDVLENTRSKTLPEAHEKLLALIQKEHLEKVYEEIEKPLIPVIEDVNAHGVVIDTEYLSGLAKEYHSELDALAKKIFKLAGEEFNINSPKQLGDILFTKLGIGIAGKRQKKTATGQLSTRESELVKLKDEHEIIELILSYREIQKLLSTYIDAIPGFLSPDGRLRTTFVQTGAATGRFSSLNPNLQNIPIKSERGRRIRRAFVAPKGSVLAAFDYSQVELRLAAILSGDEKLSDIFRRGEDVHAAVAARVFDVPEEDVTHEMRRRAKVINFGILYGMGVNALQQSLGTNRAEAQEFYNKYFETFSTLAEYLTKTRASAARLGYTTTLFGRRRYFPGIKSKIPYVRAAAERMAINAPMQGTQSDIIKIAMVRIHEVLKRKFGADAAIVLQIHDELIFEIKEGVLEDAAEEIRAAMQNVLSKKEANDVPILVSSAAGPNWGEMEKI